MRRKLRRVDAVQETQYIESRGMEVSMETRLAVISIIVEKPQAVDALNALLHEYRDQIIGRMGLPYRERNVNIICVAIDAPIDAINRTASRIHSIFFIFSLLSGSCNYCLPIETLLSHNLQCPSVISYFIE